jgi:riboflavin kinase / FMN adenylyltransferase
MEVITDFLDSEGIEGAAYVTIGTFDGLHLGHRRVIEAVTTAARESGGVSIVITFDPHPRSIFGTYEYPLLLTSTEHKIRLLEQTGLDKCIIIKFTAEFADISAGEFIDILNEKLDLKKIILGHNSGFGKKRRGDVDFVKSAGEKLGFELEVIPAAEIEGVQISSTLIREYIHSGELELAAECLGRKFQTLGTVVKGDTLGRKLGYPTANIDPHNEVVPPSGVYAVRVALEGKKYTGILNIGYRPTIKGDKQMSQAVEAHIFDFEGDVYGCDIEITFEKWIREETRFPNKNDLVAQIKKDEIIAKKLFDRAKKIC